MADGDGTNVRKVLSGLWSSWSPHDDLILYETDNHHVLCVARPDGTHMVQIATTPCLFLPGPNNAQGAFSPDEREVAYVSQDECTSGSTARYGLYVVGIDGSGRRMLATPPYVNEVDWSSQGLIAFATYSEIDAVNPDGTGRRFLASPSQDGRMAWSPDGTKLAFMSDSDTVSAVNADGTGVHTVFASGGGIVDFAWSPDSTRLVVPGVIAHPGQDAEFGVFVANADGSGFTKVLNEANFDLDWSPDGRQISFGSPAIGPETEIDVVELDGTNRRVLVSAPPGYAVIHAGDRLWNESGTHILFTAFPQS